MKNETRLYKFTNVLIQSALCGMLGGLFMHTLNPIIFGFFVTSVMINILGKSIG